jgi:hypothetical protein
MVLEIVDGFSKGGMIRAPKAGMLETIVCEQCGSKAYLVYIPKKWAGTPYNVPRIVSKPDGMYFLLVCPNCGKREQCISLPNDRSQPLEKLGSHGRGQ